VTHFATDDSEWITVDVHAPRTTGEEYREDFHLRVTDLSQDDGPIRYALNVWAPTGSVSFYTSDPYTLARQLREAADQLDGANLFS
jgi:hypothetical protein